MKISYLILFGFLAIASGLQAQEINYSVGLKGGISYTLGGEVRGSSSNASYWSGTVQGEGAIGFHGGAFFELSYGRFFFRPEVVYSSLTQEFAIPLREENTVYSVETFTVPILVGFNIYGPIDIYAGPVYSNILESNLEGIQGNQSIVVQNSPINAQAGIKIEYGRFGVDLRYEHSLSSVEQQQVDFDNNLYGGPNGGANRGWVEDGRLNQIMVSLNIKIFDSSLNTGRRRGGGCYF